MTDPIQTPLLIGLRRPEAYPHPVREIDVRETHISWIVLTGKFAYKIKKPVRFDFLDFSTLERRQHFCREELRLNRRYAKELYLDVVPISGPLTQPRVDDSTDPVEYAVKMSQFPDEALLSGMIEAGRLLPTHIDELAVRIAEFHDSAQQLSVSPNRKSAAESLGSAEEVRKEAEENFTALAGVLPKSSREKIDELLEWTRQSVDTLRDQFENRLRTGFVRECHGDLHLANLIFWRGRVLPFDGIEFNDRFRWIDVLSDAAFLAMDLDDRGRADLSRRFTNAYLQQTGDYSGVAVWRWYLVYRALVRAKVAALRMSQQTGAEVANSLDEVIKYVDQASHWIASASPSLCITFGLSGSGKTFGTQSLLEQTGAIRVRSDVERKRLFDLSEREASHSEIGEGIYSRAASEQTYQRLLDCAAAMLGAGHNVIVDAAFLNRAWRDRFRALARQRQVEFRILPFTADESTLRRRIIARKEQGSDPSEADREVLEHQLATIEPLGEDELKEISAIG